MPNSFERSYFSSPPPYSCGDIYLYRFSFNGKEKIDEINGAGNDYDYGARIYDARLGRWLAVDPKAGKYTSLSPYHFGNNNPIITIDPNGEENIIVIGGPGPHNNVYNFAESAIKQANAYKAEANMEKTTLIIMNAGYTPVQIDEITKIAVANGLGSPVIINSASELVSYINNGNTKSAFPTALSQERLNDPITDLAVFAHGTVSDAHGVGINLAYDESPELEKQGLFGNNAANALSSSAFGKESNGDCASIDLYSCNAASEGPNGETPIAQTLNNSTKAQVKGFVGTTSYHSINLGNNKKKDGEMAPNGAANMPKASENQIGEKTYNCIE